MTTYVPIRRSCPFGPIDVEYDERVLVPREWTVQQSRWAAELAATAEPGPILELCAGAGQIGLAAAVLADRDLVQVELNEVAADYATLNAARAGRGERVQVRRASLQTALQPDETFPLVLADPPYLPTASIGTWPDDPPSAIDGGSDGLDVITDCLTVAHAHLRSRGALLLQIAGPAQAERVLDILRADPSLTLYSKAMRVHDAERAVMLLVRP